MITEQIEIKRTNKKYKFIIDNGGKEVREELQDFFGKDGADISMAKLKTKPKNKYIGSINIKIGRLKDNTWIDRIMHTYEIQEDYRKIPEKLFKDWRLQIWGILKSCQEEEFKVQDEVYKKQEIFDILKLEDA